MQNRPINPSALRRARKEKEKQKPQQPKSYKLLIRFTAEQKAVMEKAAKAVGMRKTDYCRACILRQKIRDKSPEEQRFRLVITQGCNNINQIAHHLNRESLHAETLSKVNAMLAWFREIKNLSNNN